MIVVWQITERCNLSCPFCLYDRRQPGTRKTADADVVRRFGHVLADFRRQTGHRVLLSWLGGEPLLWPPLFDVCQELRSQGLELSLTTNGTTLHRQQVQDAILETLTELTISVDGLADTHDRLRQWSGGWQHLRSAIQALAAKIRRLGAGPKLRVNSVLMRDNVAEFPALCRELSTWGIQEITFNQLGGRDRPEFFPAHRLLPEQVNQLRNCLPELRIELATKNLTLRGDTAYLDRIYASSVDKPLAVDNCGPGETFLFIDADSRISPCSFTGDDLGIPLDEIRAAEDLLALPGHFAKKRAQRLSADCANCPSTRVFAKFGG